MALAGINRTRACFISLRTTLRFAGLLNFYSAHDTSRKRREHAFSPPVGRRSGLRNRSAATQRDVLAYGVRFFSRIKSCDT